MSVTKAEAMAVSCPECHAKKNHPCVYIQPKAPVGTAAWAEQNARAGLPTVRPHTRRFAKAHLAQRVARRNAQRDRYAQEQALSPERDAILRANAQAVADEQHQLITWLTQHGSILL